MKKEALPHTTVLLTSYQQRWGKGSPKTNADINTYYKYHCTRGLHTELQVSRKTTTAPTEEVYRYHCRYLLILQISLQISTTEEGHTSLQPSTVSTNITADIYDYYKYRCRRGWTKSLQLSTISTKYRCNRGLKTPLQIYANATNAIAEKVYKHHCRYLKWQQLFLLKSSANTSAEEVCTPRLSWGLSRWRRRCSHTTPYHCDRTCTKLAPQVVFCRSSVWLMGLGLLHVQLGEPLQKHNPRDGPMGYSLPENSQSCTCTWRAAFMFQIQG